MVIRRAVSEKLPPEEQSKVLLFGPKELVPFFDEQAAREASWEVRVKGYRVKVEYQAVSEAEKQKKREAVGEVVAQSLRRLRDGT